MAKVRDTYNDYEPLSLIPANGWQAVYAIRDESDGEKGAIFAHASPLMAFALSRVTRTWVYENGRTREEHEGNSVVGLDAADAVIAPVEEAANFVGYLAPGEPIPAWMEQDAREHVEKRATTGPVRSREGRET